MLAEKGQAGQVKDSVISLLGQGWTSFCRGLCALSTQMHICTHTMPVIWGQGQALLTDSIRKRLLLDSEAVSNSGEKSSVPGQGVADSAGVQAFCWEELGLTESLLSASLPWLVVGPGPAGGRFLGSLWPQPRDPECFLGH